jgi:Flp pilus assembly protein TadG
MKVVKKLRREDGAAAVEFALIVGVLAMLIFGMLQFGLAFFELQNLRAATREGARYGSVQGSVAEIQNKVETYSGVTGLGSSVVVRTRTGNTLSAPVTSTATKPCAPATGNAPDSVQASVPISGAPQSVREIFSIDVPLLPTMVLTPTISGEFRCES